jgi:hypothetical protein
MKIKKTIDSLCYGIACIIVLISATFSLARGQGAVYVLADKSDFVLTARFNESECKPLIAQNETNASLTIERIQLGTRSFCEITDLIPLPHKLSPGESVQIGYACFRPQSSGQEYDDTINIVCSPKKAGIGAVHVHAISRAEPKIENIAPTTQGAILAFDPISIKEGTLISMVGKDAEFMRSFTFKNTSANPITVTGLDFEKHDQRFEISKIEPEGSIPLEVAPGASFSLRIMYHSFERTPFNNTLLISTESSKEPVKYEIRGFQLPLSAMEWNKRNAQGSK